MDQGDGIQYDSLLNMLGNGLVSEGRSFEPDGVMTGSPMRAAGIKTLLLGEKSSSYEPFKVIIAGGEGEVSVTF